MEAEDVPMVGLFGCVSAAVIVLIVCLGITATGGWSRLYSSGERVGTLVKVTRKGIVFQAWEVDLNLGSVASGNSAVNMKSFTLPDDQEHAALVKECQDALNAGKPVAVTYNQWMVKSLYSMTNDHMLLSVKPLADTSGHVEQPPAAKVP